MTIRWERESASAAPAKWRWHGQIRLASNVRLRTTTFLAVNAREIEQTETELASMIEELDASEFDLKGLAELKTLLEGG